MKSGGQGRLNPSPGNFLVASPRAGSSHLAPFLETGGGGHDLFHVAAIVLEDVPLRATDVLILAGRKDRGPLGEVAIVRIAHQPAVTAMGRLDMHGFGAAGELLHFGNLVDTRRAHVAQIDLHEHVFAGAMEEDVPGRFAVDPGEVDRVAVVVSLHPVRLQFRGQGAEGVGDILPLLLCRRCRACRGNELPARREERNTKPGVADDLIAFDRLLQLLVVHGVESADVIAHGLQTVPIEDRAHGLGITTTRESRVELNPFEAQAGQLSQSSFGIGGEGFADGPKLNPERKGFPAVAGFGGKERAGAGRHGGGGEGGGSLEEVPATEGWSGHGL